MEGTSKAFWRSLGDSGWLFLDYGDSFTWTNGRSDKHCQFVTIEEIMNERRLKNAYYKLTPITGVGGRAKPL